MTTPKSTIDIRRLKQFAVEHFLPKSILRQVLAMDREQLSSEEFLSRIDVWLKILTAENSYQKVGGRV